MTNTSTAPAKPAKVQPLHTVDFDTRLMLTGLGMNVKLSDIIAKVDETAPLVMTVIDEAAELLAADTPEPKTFQPNSTLAKARAIIEQRGWAQNTFGHETGPVCALGAIRTAVYGPQWMYGELGSFAERDAVNELLARIADREGHGGWSIPGFNDREGQTRDVVVSLLY